MELRLFSSCISFLWAEENPVCDADPRPGASGCPWDPALLLRRINDPDELRRVVCCLGDGVVDGRIPLSRLLLPFELHHRPANRSAHQGGCSVVHDRRDGDDEEGEEEESRHVTVEDAVAAVSEADSLACFRSLISAFDFYDRDGDGVISGADLLLALRDLVGGLRGGSDRLPSATACENTVAAFGSGGVCFDDFVRLMMGPAIDNSSVPPTTPPPPDAAASSDAHEATQRRPRSDEL